MPVSFAISEFSDIKSYNPPSAIQDCYFYHTMDLPKHPTQQGHWDLRGAEDRYLGHVEFGGKTAFDCGTASGFMAFEMERRGATVTSLDLDENQDPVMGTIPYWDYERKKGFSRANAILNLRASQARLRNSFLYSRAALSSHVKLMTGNIMLSPIPADVRADIALFGVILLHLRDPVAALLNVAQNVKETIIITETLEIDDVRLDAPPTMLFRPTADAPQNTGTWFYLSPSCLKNVLRVSGFNHFTIEKLDVKNELTKTMVPYFCLVASR